MSPDEALAAAWTTLAPGRDPSIPYPRGFWPDVARVAVAMIQQGTTSPVLDFTPTRCTRGNYPESARREGKTSGGKISAAEKKANTAALLATIKAGAAR